MKFSMQPLYQLYSIYSKTQRYTIGKNIKMSKKKLNGQGDGTDIL